MARPLLPTRGITYNWTSQRKPMNSSAYLFVPLLSLPSQRTRQSIHGFFIYNNRAQFKDEIIKVLLKEPILETKSRDACECYFGTYSGLGEWWDKDQEAKTPLWLLSWWVKWSLVPLQKIKKLKSVSSLQNKEKFGVKQNLRQDLMTVKGMDLEFKQVYFKKY